MGIELTNWLLDKDFQSNVYIYGDATSQKNSTLGATFFTQIINGISKVFHYENRVQKSNPNVSLSGIFVNKILKGDYEWKLLIHEDCGYAISDYTDTLEDENGSIQKKRVTDSMSGLSYEKNGHFVDALRYFLVTIFKTEFKQFVKKRIF
jgi:hypothetical protein